MSAINDLRKKTEFWYSQIAAVMALANKTDNEVPDLSVYYDQIAKIYDEDYELSKLIDSSDIIFHADGPDVENHMPKLAMVNGLFGDINRQLRSLALSVLDLSMDDADKAVNKLDIRLAGLAPGSLYAGFLIQPPSGEDLLGTDEQNELMRSIKNVTLNLTGISEYLNKDGTVNEAINEFITDPAVRDSTMLAAFRLAPTGRRGFNTLDIINPKNSTSSTLDVADRTNLRNSLDHRPIIPSRSKLGKFTGYLRQVDLDKTRVDLRGVNIEGINNLRCILPTLTAAKGREILGKFVEVTGRYETTPSGRPSLMKIENIKVVENHNIDFSEKS
jgi:hypothetical protein